MRGPVDGADPSFLGSISAPLVFGWTCSGWGCDHDNADPLEPDPALMGLGAALLLSGGVTLHFGAEKLRLAGPFVDPWAE